MLSLLLTLACGAAPTPPPAPPDPWTVVAVAGAPVPLFAYPEPILRYAPDDRGAYVVRLAADDAVRTALRAELGVTDDIMGDDGYVVRLSAAAREALAARPGVLGIAILQPADRRSLLHDRATELPEARIDLFADATAAEVAAVGAWVTWRGGRVVWSGRTAVRVRMPREAIAEASRLSPVRWIE